jgi:hypothetical protein
MGQEGFPISLAILFGLTILGAMLTIGLIVSAIFLAGVPAA